MSEREPLVYASTEEFDARINRHTSVAIIDINKIFESADAALVALGRKLAPGHPFLPLRTRVVEKRERTKSALAAFYDAGNTDEWHGEGYRIMPGELGPVPENLQTGKTYKLRGFATTELVCCSLWGASAWRYDDGAYSFLPGAERDLEYFDDAPFRYDGEFTHDCDTCQSRTQYDSFTKLHPNGSEVLDEFYVPLQYATLRGMVVATEDSDFPVAA